MDFLALLGDFSRITLALWAIVNPLSAVPFFIALTQGKSPVEQLRLARVAGQSVFLVLVFSALLGERVLDFFHVGLPAFRVGGGILLLLMAIDMMQSRPRPAEEEADESASLSEVAVVPLSVPLLSGPGAISTTILYAHEVNQWGQAVTLGGAIAVAALATWLNLRLAAPIGRRLGKSGISIVARLMGLLLAAIAVDFITGGLLKIFPGWAGG